jgi:hypothetical protein
MITIEVFTDESPLSNQERLAIYQQKKQHWKTEQWWLLTHPEDDGIIVDPTLPDYGPWEDLPDYLKKQAE